MGGDTVEGHEREAREDISASDRRDPESPAGPGHAPETSEGVLPRGDQDSDLGRVRGVQHPGHETVHVHEIVIIHKLFVIVNMEGYIHSMINVQINNLTS